MRAHRKSRLAALIGALAIAGTLAVHGAPAPAPAGPVAGHTGAAATVHTAAETRSGRKW